MEIGRCLRDAWKLLVKDLGPIVVIAIVSAVLVAAGGVAAVLASDLMLDRYGYYDDTTDPGFASYAVPLLIAVGVAVVVAAWAFNALLKIMVRRVREGRAAAFGDLRQGFEGYGTFLAATAVLTILIGLGFVAFIVPGIILATIWCYVLVIIADRRRGLGVALSESKELAERPGYGMTLLTLLGGSVVAVVVASILVFMPLIGQVLSSLLIVYLLAFLVVMYFQAAGEVALLDHALHGAALSARSAQYAPSQPEGCPPVPPAPSAPSAPESPGGWTAASQQADEGMVTPSGAQASEGAPRTIVPVFGDVTRTPASAVAAFACGLCAMAALRPHVRHLFRPASCALGDHPRCRRTVAGVLT